MTFDGIYCHGMPEAKIEDFKKETLSDKIVKVDRYGEDFSRKAINVKEKIQNVERRIKGLDMGEFITTEGMFLDGMFQDELDKILNEEIGEGILKNE